MRTFCFVACVVVCQMLWPFRWLLVVVGLLWSCSAFGDDSTAIRNVLQRNFDACTHEDIKALMDTQARSLPRQDMVEFRAAAEKMFADTDVYLGLEDFELTQVKPPFAAARVVQVTLPKNEADRQNPDKCERLYRNHTMLLPAYERVEYIQTFKREGGKWRLWEIVTEPKPVQSGASQDTPVVANCPDGKCIKRVKGTSVFQ